jgi:PAS domain S-box-containing protein
MSYFHLPSREKEASIIMATQPESRVLGKLLILQQNLEILPTREEQATFIQRTLHEVPGLADARFCFPDRLLPECPSANAACVLMAPKEVPAPSSMLRHCAGEFPELQSIPLRTAAKLYGFMILTIADPAALASYAPYLLNIANSLANLLEKQAMSAELHQALHGLEQQVEARTAELAQKNAALEREIEQRKQVETALQQAYGVLEQRVRERTAALEASEERLRESEAFVRRVLDSLIALVGVLTPDGTIIEMNRKPLEAAGITFEEVRGKKLWECGWWNYSPDVQQQLIAAAEQARQGHMSRYDTEVRMADGEMIPIDFMLAPLRDDTGRVTHLVPSAIPIAGRKRMEHALREADRRKDEFLAMLGHELRNPLAPIRNATQILRIRGKHLADFQRPVEIIERQVTHLTHLVDDLLDVSRITRGKITLQKGPVDLATIVHRAVEINQPLIEARHHRLIVILPPHDLSVEGDKVRLVQIVGNLLNNAAKYSEDGARIELTIEQGGEWAILRVRDTGLGIAPEMLPYIFDLFSQGERGLDRAQGGLGIGLSLVKSLVKMHGGRIEARSCVGQGSEFTIRLPLLIQAAESISAPGGA